MKAAAHFQRAAQRLRESRGGRPTAALKDGVIVFTYPDGTRTGGTPHCCDCPHVDYTTTSVKRHEHECQSCGAVFVDAERIKIYWHYKGVEQR